MTLTLAVRSPDQSDSVDMVGVYLGPRELRKAILAMTLPTGRLTKLLTRYLYRRYPQGFIVEGFGDQTYKEGEFVETDIRCLN